MSIFEYQYPQCRVMNIDELDTVRTDHHHGSTTCPRCAAPVYDGSRCCTGKVRWRRHPDTDDIFLAELTYKGKQVQQRQWLATPWGR